MIKENHPDNNVGNIEYIRREDALNAISCDITITGKENAEIVCKAIASFADGIKALPSADVVLVVRCKDCKHFYFADNRIPQEQRYVCEISGEIWKPDSFCSYGEREE